MRRFEDNSMDAEMLAELDAIDATLAGEAVDPEYAELAELALLLASERELPSEDFVHTLNIRAARRFAPDASPAPAAPATPGDQAASRPAPRRRSSRPGLRWLPTRPAPDAGPGWRPTRPAPRFASRLTAPRLATALAGGLALVVAGVVVADGGLSGGVANNSGNRLGPYLKPPAASQDSLFTHAKSNGSPVAVATSTTAIHSPAATKYSPENLTTVSTNGRFGSAGSKRATGQSIESIPATSDAGASDLNSTSNADVPAPVGGSGGRQIQTAQVSLTTPNNRINIVSEELFEVVAAERGTVKQSQVTSASGGAGSYATFSLSIPTGNLQETLNRLSQLRYASVSSRTDGTSNVSSQYNGDQTAIANEKALRTSLLKQLEDAETQQAIDSIQAQLKLADNQLASDEQTLANLQHRISFSTLQVQINATPFHGPVHPLSSGGFTLGRASHDAGRVLVVAAGVALIACAALVPTGLVVALLFWLGYSLRRRRREHALDAS